VPGLLSIAQSLCAAKVGKRNDGLYITMPALFLHDQNNQGKVREVWREKEMSRGIQVNKPKRGIHPSRLKACPLEKRVFILEEIVKDLAYHLSSYIGTMAATRIIEDLSKGTPDAKK